MAMKQGFITLSESPKRIIFSSWFLTAHWEYLYGKSWLPAKVVPRNEITRKNIGEVPVATQVPPRSRPIITSAR